MIGCRTEVSSLSVEAPTLVDIDDGDGSDGGDAARSFVRLSILHLD